MRGPCHAAPRHAFPHILVVGLIETDKEVKKATSLKVPKFANSFLIHISFWFIFFLVHILFFFGVLNLFRGSQIQSVGWPKPAASEAGNIILIALNIQRISIMVYNEFLYSAQSQELHTCGLQ